MRKTVRAQTWTVTAAAAAVNAFRTISRKATNQPACGSLMTVERNGQWPTQAAPCAAEKQLEPASLVRSRGGRRTRPRLRGKQLVKLVEGVVEPGPG